MGKIDVNGANQHALYSYLKSQAGGLFNSNIKWNFTKFLVDPDGRVVANMSVMEIVKAKMKRKERGG